MEGTEKAEAEPYVLGEDESLQEEYIKYNRMVTLVVNGSEYTDTYDLYGNILHKKEKFYTISSEAVSHTVTAP